MGAPNTFKTIHEEATAKIAAAKTREQLDQLRTDFLGRKGTLTTALREISELPDAKRKAAGKRGNTIKQELDTAFRDAIAALSGQSKTEAVDITLPGTTYPRGHVHPVSLVLEEIQSIFRGMGFSFVDGPEVEDDWHNFESLNIPPGHPGRDMQDTFYVAGSEDGKGNFGLLPRTQTTAVTSRTLETLKPPFRVITLGKVFRNENEDATHGAVFHQLDGVMVDKDVSFTDLKGVLTEGLKQLLGDDMEIRFRPSYFPFTEPSAEIDISMPHIRNGEWIEIAGAGMLHPQVLRNVKYDPKEFQSFAWAWGVERIAMFKYGIQDLRIFTHPDVRILEQF